MTACTIPSFLRVLSCSVLGLASISCTPSTMEPGPAEIAYELRMNGKLDEAKRILEDALSQDSTYAEGQYELSRLKLRQALGGNPRQMESTIREARESIDRAIEQDSTNAIYAYYAGHVGFMQAFISLNMGEPSAAKEVARCFDAFETVLRLRPDHVEAKLLLVELHGAFPAEVGGDRSKAVAYASELAKADEILGVKARSVLEEVGVADWRSLRAKDPGNTNVLEELGKAYLWEGNVAKATECFAEANEIDSSEAILFMDLGRYHFVSLMEMGRKTDDPEARQAHLEAAEAAMLRYIASEPPASMKAHALGMLSRVKQAGGDKEAQDRLMEEAMTLDPYHSRATVSPGPVLFTPPGLIERSHRYLTRPF